MYMHTYMRTFMNAETVFLAVIPVKLLFVCVAARGNSGLCTIRRDSFEVQSTSSVVDVLLTSVSSFTSQLSILVSNILG